MSEQIPIREQVQEIREQVVADERRPTVREEIGETREHVAVMKNDIQWIKRAVLGLYGLAGTLLVAFLASLAHGQSPAQTAHVLVGFLL